MSREQIIADALSAISAGQAQVLSDAIGAAVDASAMEQKASDGTLSQSDVDAAVAAAVQEKDAALAALQAQDDLDKAAAVQAKADGDAAVAAVQAKLDELSAKEGVEAAIIEGLKGSLGVLQDVVSKLAGLQSPAPEVPVEPQA